MSLITPCTDTSRRDDGGERAQQRVDPAALDARLDAASPLPACRQALAADLDDGRHERPGRLTGTREVAEVAGAGATLLAPAGAAHRQHGPLGVAGEQVAVARAVVGQQTLAVGVGPLDRRRALRMVRHDDLAGRLVDPAERRHVGGRAVQDPALADAGLRRPAGLPADQLVGAVAQPAMQGGHVAGTQRPPQHRVGDAVELDEHDAGHVGDVGVLRSPAGLPRDALVEPRRRRRAPADALIAVVTMHEADDDPERRPEAVDVDARQQRRAPRRTTKRVEDDRAEARASAPRAERRGTPAPATRRR